MPNDSLSLSRRAFGAGLAAGAGFLAFAQPVRALTVDQARGLIDKVVNSRDVPPPSEKDKKDEPVGGRR